MYALNKNAVDMYEMKKEKGVRGIVSCGAFFHMRRKNMIKYGQAK